MIQKLKKPVHTRLLLWAAAIFVFTTFANAQNMRTPTASEKEWDKKVTESLQKVLLDAASKMKQNWHVKTPMPKITPEFTRDVTAYDHLPLALECSLLLQYDPWSDESGKNSEAKDKYNDLFEKLSAANDTAALRKTDNPFFSDEIYISAMVNPHLLNFYPFDSTQSPPHGIKLIKLPGAVLSFIKTSPPSPENWQKPATIAYIGDKRNVYGDRGKPIYKESVIVKGTDVKVILFQVITSIPLAEEFYSNLDLKAIEQIIADN